MNGNKEQQSSKYWKNCVIEKDAFVLVNRERITLTNHNVLFYFFVFLLS